MLDERYGVAEKQEVYFFGGRHVCRNHYQRIEFDLPGYYPDLPGKNSATRNETRNN